MPSLQMDNVSSSDNEKTSYEISPNRGKVWKYFKLSEDDENKANCLVCDQLVTCKSDSNLKYHILKEHGSIEFDDAKSSDEEKEHLDAGKVSSSKKRRSQVWKYFVLKDADRKVATCKICRKDLSYLSTIGNLMKHIRNSHRSNEYKNMINNQVDEETSVKNMKAAGAASSARSSFSSRNARKLKFKKEKHFRKFRSSLWKYFDVQDRDSKKAKCRLCKCTFIYTCLSNLNKHLMRKHGVFANAGDNEMEIVTTSPIWAYFKCLDESLKIASCLICKKRLEYSGDSDLARHLARKHPNVDVNEIRTKPKKLMITDNGDIYEIDDDVAKQEPEPQDDDSDDWNNHHDEIEALHSTEYIDEEMLEDPVLTPIIKKRKRPSNSSTSNIQPSQEECSIEIFGKYVVSLLKKLPKHKSDKLQVDFVRQIMEAQLSDDKNISYENTSYNTSQNTRYNASFKSQDNNRYGSDDAHVTSNSEVQRVLTRDGVIENAVADNERIIVTSARHDITVERT